MMKKYVIYLFALLSLAVSCDKSKHSISIPDELGATEREHYVEAEGGEVEFTIYANKSGDVTVSAEDAGWITLSENSFSGDFTLRVSAAANQGFQRRADLVLATSTRKDTISIFQKGSVEEKCHIKAQSLVIYNDSDLKSFETDINVPLSQVHMIISYSDDQEWISNCTLTAKNFTFSAEANTDDYNLRKAFISFEYKNGWDEVERYLVTVLQAKADNKIGTIFTAEELREVATVDGYMLPDDAIIEGIIVSDRENGQAGDLQVLDYQQGTGVINYDDNELTAYMMSADGKHGFKLMTPTDTDNEFKRFTKVGINAPGAVVSKTADEPVRYTISNISSNNIMTSADVDVPVREKYINELTDDDMFTFVTLKDCEIPMRKGPFMPVNEGYTPVNTYNRCAKYPMLIRDVRGGSMYMFFNNTCPYRRDGSRMPYGSGKISGVVVHEIYKSFEKDGKIGRYQLRHFHREEIALAENFEDSFSGLITEFRYVKKPGEFETTSLSDAILATAGNGEMCHTYGAVNNYSPTYMYLGPADNKNNQWKNGAGIILEDGTDYLPVNGKESSQNTEGKCDFSSDLLLSWSNKYWWDEAQNQGYCWLVKFSTKGISSDGVSMQFAMYNNSQSARSPRYWKAQYSLTTSDCSASAADQWKDIAEFTVHDVAIWATQNDWQTLGTRVYDFPLPTEILGKDNVYIRLMPRNNKAAAKSATSYDSSTIANNSGYNTMDYFAVRYNK